MNIKNRVKIVWNAYKKTNDKKRIIKKIFKILADGGFSRLKYAIYDVSRKQINFEDIYDCQQKTMPVSYPANEFITVIIEVSSIDTDITATINSLKSQSYTNFHIKLIAPYGYKKHTDYNTNYFMNFPGEVYKNVIAGIESNYFVVINGSNVLHPNALGLFAMSVEKKRNAFSYSDECIFDGENGSRLKYFIKPDYSEIYQINTMYIQQAVIFSKAVACNFEHFFSENLSFSARMNDAVCKALQLSESVNHINFILLLRNSFSEDMNVIQNIAVIERNLNNNGYVGKSFYKENGKYSIALSTYYPKVTVIIPSEQADKLEKCINSILVNTEYPLYEIIVVTKETINEELYLDLKNLFKIKFIKQSKSESFNYSKMCNLGAEFASGEILLFLDDTVKIKLNGWLSRITSCFTFSKIGAVSPKILREDNTIRYAGIISGGFGFFPIPFNGDLNEWKPGVNDYAFTNREISVLSATCIAIRKQVFEDIKGFNASDTPDKFSNVDLSYKVQKEGYDCFFCSESIIYSLSENWYDSWFDTDNNSVYLYILKNYMDKLQYDPYFTDQMKYSFLKNIPHDNAFYCGHKANKPGRSILLVTHELSLTGAPIAVHYAAKTILDNGNYPVVVSPYDGRLRNELVSDGIDVIIDPTINGSDFWVKWACNFDLIIVSTLVQYHSINQFNGINIPIIWWIHESKESYLRGADRLIPSDISKNIHVYCGGGYAKETLKNYRPSYNPKELLYCVPDYAAEISTDYSYKLENIDGKLVFVTIGTIEKRKGQDIFAKAIMSLPEEYVKKCRFFIIGRRIDDNVYKEVLNLKSMHPEQVTLINEVSRSEIRDVYSQSDAIVCSSIDDPMPVFMTECLMLSKIAICSENTGTASLLQDGVNGFIYKDNDYMQLKEKIMYVIDNYDKIEKIGIEGRKAYEMHFTEEAFHSKITKIVNNLLDEG